MLKPSMRMIHRRNEYDFTFAVESDTQYYNEDYEDNQDQTVGRSVSASVEYS